VTPRILVIALLFAAVGCDQAEQPPSGQASFEPVEALDLELVSSVRLIESEQTALGRIVGLVVGDGGVFVGDALRSEVVVFDRSGGYLRTIGRQGDGPGEFRRVSSLFMVRGELWVYDVRAARISRFDPESGDYLGAIPTQLYVRDAVELDDGRIVFGAADGEGAALAVLEERDGSLAVVPFAPITDFHRDNSPIRATYGLVSVARGPDGRVLWATSPEILIFTSDVEAESLAPPIDTLRPPIDQRRSEDPVALYHDIAVDQGMAAYASRVGFATELERTASSTVLVVLEQNVRDDRSRTGRLWVTVFSNDLARACVDLGVRPEGTGVTDVFVRGDTLFEVDFDFTPAGETRTLLNQYLLPVGEACPPIA